MGTGVGILVYKTALGSIQKLKRFVKEKVFYKKQKLVLESRVCTNIVLIGGDE